VTTITIIAEEQVKALMRKASRTIGEVSNEGSRSAWLPRTANPINGATIKHTRRKAGMRTDPAFITVRYMSSNPTQSFAICTHSPYCSKTEGMLEGGYGASNPLRLNSDLAAVVVK